MIIPLAGCVTAPSKTAPFDILPPVKEYTIEEQKQGAVEMATCTNCAMLKTFAGDFLIMRDKTRAAQVILREKR